MPPHTNPENRRPGQPIDWVRKHWPALFVTAVSLYAVIAIAVDPGFEPPAGGTTASSAPTDGMLDVAPGGVITASDIPDSLKAVYHGAEEHQDTYQAVPCFCGCEAMLGHRHLGDCFLRPDGSGYEAHALGCGVCVGEALQVLELIERGITDHSEIRQAVVAEWGDPYQEKGSS